MGNVPKQTFPGHFSRESAVREIIHSDNVGNPEPSFPNRFQYVCTFIDDHSRYTLLEFLRTQDELNKAFSMMASEFSRIAQYSKLGYKCWSTVLQLHSDGAKE